MRYSYEYKLKCIEMYKEGRWPETPEGIKDPEYFRDMIRQWVRIEEANGPEKLRHKDWNKEWSPEERLELVVKVMAGSPIRLVAFNAGINQGMLWQWVQKYKREGYNGLVFKKKGRPPKEPQMKKPNHNKPRKLKESEYEELIRLRAENEYIKAENEVIKKEIALREEKEAARLKAKKQRSSKNLEQTDIP